MRGAWVAIFSEKEAKSIQAKVQRRQPSKFSTPSWDADGEIQSQRIINMKRTQKVMTYLRVNSNSHRERTCYLSKSQAVLMRQLTHAWSSLTRPEWHSRGKTTTKGPPAHSTARKSIPRFVDSLGILLCFNKRFGFYVPQTSKPEMYQK